MSHCDDSDELLPIVLPHGEVIGTAPRGRCHDGSKLLHPVVHLHLFDPQGSLYLQKRPGWKSIQPGKWDTAVGGHIAAGETPEEALRREAAEEIGLTDFVPRALGQYVWESAVERELVYVFAATTATEPTPSDETDGGRFWPIDEIMGLIGTPQTPFTPNFESEFLKFFTDKAE